MKLILSKSAVKFLKKIPAKDSQKVKDKIHRLLYLAVEIDLTQSRELDIKTLKGDLQGFLRMRVGKLRVVFTIDWQRDELLIHDIDFRGDIY